MTLTGMRVLAAVAARGSFTAAARELGYTQSAVSRQVSLMEQATGGALFERQPRGVRPTTRGAALLVHVTAVLERLAAAELELGGLEEPVAGRVSLGAFPTALADLVPRALSSLAQDHPGLVVRLREGGSVAQLRRVRAGQIDVALIARGGGLDYPLEDLAVDGLLLGEPMLAVADGHRLAERGWVGVGELREERWIVGEASGEGPQFGVWPTLSGSDPQITYSVRDWPARLGLVSAGLGVAMIPSLLLWALPPGVRALRVDDPRPLRREVVAATRPDRSANTAALIKSLHAAASPLAAALAVSTAAA
jgi:DNA-binding transcriptional LysR family regulator